MLKERCWDCIFYEEKTKDNFVTKLITKNIITKENKEDIICNLDKMQKRKS